ncbi:MAG: hypothetical protein IT297_08090 [Anaerolineae bacterium]|jgi:hypothetical protein|nr:hypothetical protein [Anaerolineae bacterium]MCZ7553314.1 hypothetical protein [Anaerolineales bacterium]
MRNSPGAVTGSILGTLCLVVGIGLRIFAPDFSGFFDRGLSGDAMPVWALLIGFAALNFLYAFASYAISKRLPPPGKASPPPEPPERDPKA